MATTPQQTPAAGCPGVAMASLATAAGQQLLGSVGQPVITIAPQQTPAAAHSGGAAIPLAVGQQLLRLALLPTGVKRLFPSHGSSSDNVPKKVKVLGSWIEGVTALADPSLPVTVSIARLIKTNPSQSSSLGTLTYSGVGGIQQMIGGSQFMVPAPQTQQTQRIIGTIHHPPTHQPAVIMSGQSGGAVQPHGAGIRPSANLFQQSSHDEDDDVEIMSPPPPKRTVYMVVEDGEDKNPPLPPASFVKQEGLKRTGVSIKPQGGRGGTALPSQPPENQGGQGDNTEEEPDEEEDDDDGAEKGAANPQSTEGQPQEEEDDDELYDPSDYLKSDIIELQDTAFKNENLEARKLRGQLLGLPDGEEPTLEQINSLALFALRAPLRECKDDKDDTEADNRDEVNIHHLWLPYL